MVNRNLKKKKYKIKLVIYLCFVTNNFLNNTKLLNLINESLPNIMDHDINASLNIMYLWKTKERERKEAMRNGTTFDATSTCIC